MHRSIRAVLVTILTALAVVLAGPPANAAPSRPGPQPPPGTTGCCSIHHVKVSSADQAALKLAISAGKHDVDSHGRFDWRKVKKTFGKHTSLRSAFGAGVWVRTSSWHQFTHITKADKDYIKKWAKTHKGPNPKVSSSMLMRPMKPKPCEGRTGNGTAPGWAGVFYLNSCDTRTLKTVAGVCMPASVLLLAVAVYFKDGPVAIPTALMGVACAITAGWVGSAQDASDIGAVQIFYASDGKHGKSALYIVDIVPQ